MASKLFSYAAIFLGWFWSFFHAKRAKLLQPVCILQGQTLNPPIWNILGFIIVRSLGFVDAKQLLGISKSTMNIHREDIVVWFWLIYTQHTFAFAQYKLLFVTDYLWVYIWEWLENAKWVREISSTYVIPYFMNLELRAGNL